MSAIIGVHMRIPSERRPSVSAAKAGRSREIGFVFVKIGIEIRAQNPKIGFVLQKTDFVSGFAKIENWLRFVKMTFYTPEYRFSSRFAEGGLLP
jgi:hypothetical protein